MLYLCSYSLILTAFSFSGNGLVLISYICYNVFVIIIGKVIYMNISEFYKEKIFPNILALQTTFDSIRYRNYSQKLPGNFSSLIVNKYTKEMVIQEGEYEYNYFNFCYLNNILSLVIYCLYHGYLPIIELNYNRPEHIQWTWYFEQPFSIENNFKSNSPNRLICPRRYATFQPHFQDIYEPRMIHLWGKIYSQCIKFNPQTKQYIDDEYQSILAPFKRVLGVICRGTDYVTLKPPGHPVQPDIEEILQHCQSHMRDSHYDAIYLATEEKKIRDAFVAAFPGKILENKRKYYDEIYYSNDSIHFIKDVHFQREHDDFFNGLEYLSSITLLSQCTSLIGGNCTGTMAAVFMNDNHYEYMHIYNYGVYPYN